MIKKRPDGKWLCDVQPGGRTGTRLKRVFRTQAEAKQFEIWAAAQRQEHPDWHPPKKDSRRLSDLVELWATHHAPGLKSAEDTIPRLRRMVSAMGNPFARDFTGQHFATYREARLEAGTSRNTMNREHAYLRAVLHECQRLGFWDGDNPLTRVRQFKIDARELSYLNHEQIADLLAALKESSNIHVLPVTKLCLATGARWSEAEGITIHQIRGDGRVSYVGKSGKYRAVPIDTTLEAEWLAHHKAHGVNEYLFQPCLNAFRLTVKRIGLVLPDGQSTHVLRHTFASHFMMRGGNILTLQRILGHSSLVMTMRYAHLAPEHLEEARRLNPLAAVGIPS
jgi:integrase